MITSDIGHTTHDEITIRGFNLASYILGKLDFVDSLCLCTLGRQPTAPEKNVINALLTVALDHGLTPSSIAARLTHLGAPDAFQAAIASGLLGAGSRYLGTATMAAKQLAEWTGSLPADVQADAIEACADQCLSAQQADGSKLYGFGHPIHKNGDPRVSPLREIARANGCYGPAWRVMDAIAERLGKGARPLPINASGAVGATIVDLGLDASFASGLALIGRCGGLVAHVLEEIKHPIAQQTWELILSQDVRNQLRAPQHKPS